MAPKIQHPERHLVFQSGGLESKPWDLHSSFIPKATFQNAIFTRLIYYDSNYKFKPGIFKDWFWDAKTKSYLFTIDTNLKFDENRSITAEDIEFAFLKKLLTTQQEISETQLFNIKGIGKLKKGQTFKSGMCEGIQIISRNKIQIFLTSTNPSFLYTFGDSFPAIAPIEDFNSDYYTYKTTPRGTGHYEIIWSDPNSSLIRLQRKSITPNLIKNTTFPLTIDFFSHGTALQNNADLAAGAGANDTESHNIYNRIVGKIPHGINLLEFNYSNSLGNNKDFRRAVSLAINRTDIYKTYKDTMVTHELIPSVYYGRSNKEFQFNPKLSKQIIQKKFKNISSKKKPLIALFHGKKGQEKKRYVAELTKQLEFVGLYVNFIGAEAVYFVDQNYDKVFGTYGAVTSFADPLSAITPYVPGNNPKQNTDLKDKKSIELYKNAEISENTSLRAKYISELSKHLMSEYRVLPLGELRPIFAYSKKIKTINEDKIFSVIDFNLVEMNLK